MPPPTLWIPAGVGFLKVPGLWIMRRRNRENQPDRGYCTFYCYNFFALTPPRPKNACAALDYITCPEDLGHCWPPRCPPQPSPQGHFFFFKILFIHERLRERERQRHRQREKQAPGRGLHPRCPGSHPGRKAALDRWATRAALLIILIRSPCLFKWAKWEILHIPIKSVLFLTS